MPNDLNVHPKPPTQKQAVAFEVLLGEREYQTRTLGDSPVPTIVDFANLLVAYTDKLVADVSATPLSDGLPEFSASPAGGPLKRLREIAAIALHGMEIHGIQPRANHVPASAGITGTLNVVGKADMTVKAPVLAAAPHNASAPAREAPPPTPHTDTPPHPAATPAPVAVHHEAVELPHHPPGEEHGKK